MKITKVKALNYLDHTQDSAGHQKVMEKLSAPRVRYQATRMVKAAQKVHDARRQDVLRARHYDGMWYRMVGKWLQYMGKAHHNWVHEVEWGGVPCAVHALCARCAKSWLFSTTGSSVS